MTSDSLVGLDAELKTRQTRLSPLKYAQRYLSASEMATLQGEIIVSHPSFILELAMQHAITARFNTAVLLPCSVSSRSQTWEVAFELSLSDACAGIPQPEEQAGHFIRIWTLKEAHVKAIGRGIMAAPGMQAFSIDIPHLSSILGSCQLKTERVPHIRMQPDNGGWRFVLFNVGQDHTAALCIEHTSNPKDTLTDETAQAIELRMWEAIPGQHDVPLVDFQVLAASSPVLFQS